MAKEHHPVHALQRQDQQMRGRSDSNTILHCEGTSGPEIFPLLSPGSAHTHP